MLSRERPDSSCDLSQASSMTRTLVRVADGTVALREPVANGVEHLLAAGGEVVDPLASADAGAGDQAVQAGQVELERLELELGRRGLEVSGADDELGDESGERVVTSGELGGRGAEAALEVLGRPAGLGGGEQLVEVGLRQPPLPLVGQREAVGEERALGLLAPVEHPAGAVAGAPRPP